MTNEISKRLQSAPIVPLIQADDSEVAVQIANALVAGGLTVLEVVLRTPSAIGCLQRIGEQVSGAIVGAGTVLTESDAIASVEAGAGFLVSPGLADTVVGVAQSNELPIFPGIATATELQRAWNLGLRAVKFFPAGLAGGVPLLKAFSSVFGEMKFMPTGGVSAGNLAEYLALPAVLACGGSWLTPKASVASGDFDAITKLAQEAVAIAASVRG